MTPIDLLILDEHTAALDPRAADTVMALTDQLVREKGLTTLMVTHNLKYAVNHGTRLLMMHQGKAVIDASGRTGPTIRWMTCWTPSTKSASKPATNLFHPKTPRNLWPLSGRPFSFCLIYTSLGKSFRESSCTKDKFPYNNYNTFCNIGPEG